MFDFQAEVGRLVSALRINVGLSQRKTKNIKGFYGQLQNLRKSVTALINHERIELHENRGYVTRQYTEKLISDAILYGDKHKHTMEMATFWLEEDKSAIHKLFKVLVPRYENYTKCYTSLFHAPPTILKLEDYDFPAHAGGPSKSRRLDLVCVELKGHPFPKLAYSNTKPNKKHIHNVLLAEAKKDLDKTMLKIE